jgi:hypothetical protein
MGKNKFEQPATVWTNRLEFIATDPPTQEGWNLPAKLSPDFVGSRMSSRHFYEIFLSLY